jgi:phosphotransferase system HPr (HPr) family protein
MTFLKGAHRRPAPKAIESAGAFPGIFKRKGSFRVKGGEQTIEIDVAMKTTRVTVRFPRGIHARPAASLVRLFRGFRAQVSLRLENRVAHAGSILSILLLAATFNTQLEIQATGEDEEAAICAAEAFFETDDEDAAQGIYFGDFGSSPPEAS